MSKDEIIFIAKYLCVGLFMFVSGFYVGDYVGSKYVINVCEKELKNAIK